jgi:tetratricopeptide (TPR) repeat protein
MNAILHTREAGRRDGRVMPTLVRVALLAATALALGVTFAHADDLKDARSALASGQLDEAQKLFEKVASQGFAEGAAGVGQVDLRKRDYPHALEAFQRAQKMDANLALAWYGEGEVHRRQDDCAAAEAPLRKAVDIDRKFPEAQLALGDCLVQLKKYQDAIAALNPGLNWGAKWKPRFLVALGQVEMSRDSLRDAGIYFTQAQQAAPDDPQTNRALGDFYLKRGIGSLAVPNYQKAVALDTSDVELRYALGKALEYDGQYNDALEHYRWVTERDADYAPGQLALGSLFYRSGPNDAKRYADAKPYLLRYTQLMPNDARGWSLLGRDEYFLKDKDAAVDALNKSIGMGEKSKETYTVLGRALVDKKDWTGALAAYQQGDPNGTDQLKIAQMFVFQQQTDKADSVYHAMVDKDSTSWEGKFAMVELGKLRFRAKDYPGTIALMQRRIALDPNSDEAYYYMGLSYNEMKQLPDAAAALRQATNLAPNKADRHFRLGLVLASMDSVATSNAELTRTTELDSTSTDAAVAYRQLGYRLLLAKDWGHAVELLDHAAAINPKDVQTQIWLAQGLANAGNRTRAIEVFKKVLEIQPGNPEATKGLKQLGQ